MMIDEIDFVIKNLFDWVGSEFYFFGIFTNEMLINSGVEQIYPSLKMLIG